MRVLIVNKYPVTRLGIKTAMENEGIKVIGEVSDAEPSLHLTEKLRPDVVILDLWLQNSNGIKLCRDIKRLTNAPQVVIFAYHYCPQTIYSFRASGADGYVHGSEVTSRLVEAVRGVARDIDKWHLGTPSFGHESLKHEFRTNEQRAGLTRREEEVFNLLLKRRTNLEIARELSISRLTAKTHVANILRKLNCKDRKEISRATLWSI